MNTIDEVKKIEASAKELEASYNQKILEMEKNAESQVAEMKDHIEQDLQDYQQSEEDANKETLAKRREKLEQETTQEITALKQLYNDHKDRLVNIVIEEVIKQYGNS